MFWEGWKVYVYIIKCLSCNSIENSSMNIQYIRRNCGVSMLNLSSHRHTATVVLAPSQETSAPGGTTYFESGDSERRSRFLSRFGLRLERRSRSRRSPRSRLRDRLRLRRLRLGLLLCLPILADAATVPAFCLARVSDPQKNGDNANSFFQRFAPHVSTVPA